VEAGFRYGIPVFGTAAHSWVMSFETEKAAFACLQELLGERTVQLIDSYDTLEGAREAVRLGKPLWGVRLDSGDLLALSQEVRKILDDAGLFDAKIMATNDLDEKTIGELVRGGAPIDIFGVGTSLATSYDAPALGCVYKLVEHHAAGRRRLPFKQSEGKRTLPGRKQVYRFADYDFVALEEESAPEGGVALLAPVMKNGARMTDPTPMETIQAYARQQIRDHGRAGRAIEYSSELRSWGANA
jgi:nicotinate phosphoribosyltransferase